MRRIGAVDNFTLRSLARARHARRIRDAQRLKQMLVEIVDPASAARLALAYEAKEPDPDAQQWTFAMISPMQHAAVVDWIMAESSRRNEAVRLWAALFTALHPSTGEIMLERGALAQRLKITPQDVSRIMGELASIGAIERRKDGRRVRYFMSPHVATHIPTEAARAEARAAAGPLRVVAGGKGEDSDA